MQTNFRFTAQPEAFDFFRFRFFYKFGHTPNQSVDSFYLIFRDFVIQNNLLVKDKNNANLNIIYFDQNFISQKSKKINQLVYKGIRQKIHQMKHTKKSFDFSNDFDQKTLRNQSQGPMLGTLTIGVLRKRYKISKKVL